jgi:hypothetical protein
MRDMAEFSSPGVLRKGPCHHGIRNIKIESNLRLKITTNTPNNIYTAVLWKDNHKGHYSALTPSPLRKKG